MPRITIIIGSLLIALGVIGYFVLAGPDAEGYTSPTALIPAFFGLPIVVLGWIALRPGARKHAMHAAVLIGLVGVLGALMKPVLAVFRGETVNWTATPVLMQLSMAALCLLFVVLCVNSFIQARKSRAA